MYSWVYAQTLVNVNHNHKGLQWAILNPTVVVVRDTKGPHENRQMFKPRITEIEA